MHILLAEDDAAAARSLELGLKASGHNVSRTASGEEAVELAAIYDYDAILMDLDLEDVSGLEALRKIRGRKLATPVVIVSGSLAVEAKITALAAGADDYVTKPFHTAELLARLTAVVRRSRGQSDSIIRTGPIALNLNTRSAEVSGYPVHLTPSEYKLLELLSLRKNAVLSKEACLNHLYNGISEPEIKIIDVFICKLRKKIAVLSEDGDSQIETVWGGGYMLRDGAARAPRLAA